MAKVQTVRNIEDLRALGIVDFRRLHSHWAGLIERVYFALAQRYPDGEFGATRLLDVPQLQVRPSARPSTYACAIASCEGATRPYILFSRRWMGDVVNPNIMIKQLKALEQFRCGVTYDRPDIAAVLHELLHPTIRRAISLRGFNQELSLALSPILGERYSIERFTELSFRRAMSKAFGSYHSDEAEEFLVDALMQGVMFGEQALPVAQAVRTAIDRRLRFDAAGIEQLHDLVRDRYCSGHQDAFRVAKNRYHEREYDLPQWTPLYEQLDASIAPPHIPFLPLNVSGNLTDEWIPTVTGNVMASRRNGLPPVDTLLPDPDFAVLVVTLGFRWDETTVPELSESELSPPLREDGPMSQHRLDGLNAAAPSLSW